MKLSSADKANPLWFSLKKQAEERIEMLRGRLESPNTPHDQTQIIRGQLMELREFVNSDKEPPGVS